MALNFPELDLLRKRHEIEQVCAPVDRRPVLVDVEYVATYPPLYSFYTKPYAAPEKN